jgi:hypothetical protein
MLAAVEACTHLAGLGAIRFVVAMLEECRQCHKHTSTKTNTNPPSLAAVETSTVTTAATTSMVVVSLTRAFVVVAVRGTISAIRAVYNGNRIRLANT